MRRDGAGPISIVDAQRVLGHSLDTEGEVMVPVIADELTLVDGVQKGTRKCSAPPTAATISDPLNEIGRKKW